MCKSQQISEPSGRVGCNSLNGPMCLNVLDIWPKDPKWLVVKGDKRERDWFQLLGVLARRKDDMWTIKLTEW